jgi:urea transport system substrate-binding protein
MQTESACPTPEALADLLANALPAAEAERLRLHLAGCPHCLERVSRDSQRDVPTRLGPPATTSVPAHSFPFLAPAEAEGELGRLGGYRVLGVLGEGGMGYVFDAEDPVLHRRVALKVLKPGLWGPSLRKRFLQEARLTAGLPHDHIAAVFQAGQVEVPGLGEVPFLAMEQLRGESLEARLRRDRWLPLDEALRVTREAAEGLEVAHARGLVHRDIKPGNLWLEARPGAAARDRVKILDFGLARALDGPSDLTRHGQVLGTPSYMAPEQALGVPVDQRADLYSLGCVLYRMLTGVAPFEDAAHDTVALLDAVARWAPKPVTELAPQTPRPVAQLVEQLLARNPADRPASARAVVERLRALERGEPWKEEGGRRKEEPGRAAAGSSFLLPPSEGGASAGACGPAG